MGCVLMSVQSLREIQILRSPGTCTNNEIALTLDPLIGIQLLMSQMTQNIIYGCRLPLLAIQ